MLNRDLTYKMWRNYTFSRKLLNEIKRSSLSIEALIRISARINANLNLQKTLVSLCEETINILGVQSSCVIFIDENNVPSMAGVCGQYVEEITNLPSEFLRLFINLKDNWVNFIPDLQNLEPSNNVTPLVKLGLRSLASAKIVHEDDFIGVLCAITIGNPYPFTRDDLDMLHALANMAATAIENARLFELVRIGRKRLQVLSKQLVEAQESERRYIAKELHDEVGQLLTSLKYNLEMMQKTCGVDYPEELNRSYQLVLQLIGQIRTISLELRPTALDDLGLLPTLLWHFGKYSDQTNIYVNFKHIEIDRRFTPAVETAAYRIVQEALTNVARYAKVSEVTVRIWSTSDILGIQIEDHGVGFNPNGIVSQIYTGGLSGMRERAILLGGKLTIESTPGQGTQLSAELPLTDWLERREDERNDLTRR